MCKNGFLLTAKYNNILEFRKILDVDIGKVLSTGRENTGASCPETQTNIVGRFCDTPLLLQPLRDRPEFNSMFTRPSCATVHYLTGHYNST